MRKQDIATIVVAAVILAVALVLVVVGVTRHKEPGLLSVCWVADHAQYDNCTEPTQQLKWPKSAFPLRIAVLPVNNKPTTEGVSAVHGVASDWNHQLGFAAFDTEVAPAQDADVFVFWGTEYDASNQEGGDVSHQIRRNRLQASVHITDLATNRLTYRVLFHEFGHVLGLAHDPFESSPMFTRTMDDSDAMRFMLVTDSDRKLLRRLYR
jgi:hypothetical protein